jgi:transcriptional regulator with XRE-family HTH domain
MCKAGDMHTKKDEIVVINGVTLGEKIKLTRIAMHLRQLDLASQARCNLKDIQNCERDRFILVYKSKIRAILGILSIEVPPEYLPDDDTGDESDNTEGGNEL